MEPVYVDQGALFDPSRRYRYRLWRTWDEARARVLFVMLNPSTADAFRLDPTVRRCLGFARRWGLGGLDVANLFALRASDPERLYRTRDPVGPENDRHLEELASRARLVVLAWGTHGVHLGRGAQVFRALSTLGPVHALRLTRDGHPGHPLYLPASAMPRPASMTRSGRLRAGGGRRRGLAPSPTP